MRKIRYQWFEQGAVQGGIPWINNALALVPWQNNSAFIVSWLATTNAAYVNVPTNTVLVTAQPPTATVAAGGGGAFDFYISPTGSDSNPGTLSQPWSILSLQNYTVSGGTIVAPGANVTNWNATKGKRIGLLPGIYNLKTAWANNLVKVAADTGSQGQYPALVVNGNGASQTVIASCDNSGNYSPRLAILDAHTTIGGITGITNAASAVVTTNVVAGSNPYVIGNLVAIYGVSGMTQINQQVGTISGVGGVSGSYTFTVNINTSGYGVYTSGGTASSGYPGSGGNGNGIIGQGASNPNSTYFGNVTLDGLVLTGCWTADGGAAHFRVQNGNTVGSQGGATGIIVQNCEIYDISGLAGTNNVCGVRPEFATGMIVRGNKIHDIDQASGSINCGGIISFNSRNNIYEANTFYNVCEAIYDKETPNGGHTYRYNHFELTGSVAPQYGIRDGGGVPTGQVNTAYNNLFTGTTAASGIGWDNYSNTLPPHGSYVFYNNTLYGTGAGTYSALFTDGNNIAPSGQSTVYNNIYYQTAGTSYSYEQGIVLMASDQGTHSGVLLSDYNIVHPNIGFGSRATTSIGGTETRYNTVAAWRAATGFDTHSANSTATFTSPGVLLNAPGYQLQAGSVGTVGNNPGSSDGTSGGSAVQAGCWGGVNPPATSYTGTIGCNF